MEIGQHIVIKDEYIQDNKKYAGCIFKITDIRGNVYDVMVVRLISDKHNVEVGYRIGYKDWYQETIIQKYFEAIETQLVIF